MLPSQQTQMLDGSEETKHPIRDQPRLEAITNSRHSSNPTPRKGSDLNVTPTKRRRMSEELGFDKAESEYVDAENDPSLVDQCLTDLGKVKTDMGVVKSGMIGLHMKGTNTGEAVKKVVQKLEQNTSNTNQRIQQSQADIDMTKRDILGGFHAQHAELTRTQAVTDHHLRTFQDSQAQVVRSQEEAERQIALLEARVRELSSNSALTTNVNDIVANVLEEIQRHPNNYQTFLSNNSQERLLPPGLEQPAPLMDHIRAGYTPFIPGVPSTPTPAQHYIGEALYEGTQGKNGAVRRPATPSQMGQKGKSRGKKYQTPKKYGDSRAYTPGFGMNEDEEICVEVNTGEWEQTPLDENFEGMRKSYDMEEGCPQERRQK